MQNVEIARWSGIWEKGSQVRVGVRLVDGRDALLTASFDESADGEIAYGLIINGEDYMEDFIIPSALEASLKTRLLKNKQRGSVSLKDLKLF